MKKMFIAVIMLLLYVQSLAQAQFSSSQKYKTSKSLDSLSYIQIDKVIYYQTPLEMYYGKLTSDKYEPDWYNAYCTNENADRFKNNPQEVLKYLHSSINMTDTEKVNVIKYHKPKPFIVPYSYFFGEVWLTHKLTGEKIVIVFEKDNETRLPDFTMKLPDEKNKPNEKLDSIRMQAIGFNFFVEQNGVIKLPSTSYIDSLLTNNGEYFIKPNLDDFKNMLYRSKSYRVSNRENGKRKFGTMEKGAKGFVRNAESNKP